MDDQKALEAIRAARQASEIEAARKPSAEDQFREVYDRERARLDQGGSRCG